MPLSSDLWSSQQAQDQRINILWLFLKGITTAVRYEWVKPVSDLKTNTRIVFLSFIPVLTWQTGNQCRDFKMGAMWAVGNVCLFCASSEHALHSVLDITDQSKHCCSVWPVHVASDFSSLSFCSTSQNIRFYHDSDVRRSESSIGLHYKWIQSRCLQIFNPMMCSHYERRSYRTTKYDQLQPQFHFTPIFPFFNWIQYKTMYICMYTIYNLIYSECNASNMFQKSWDEAGLPLCYITSSFNDTQKAFGNWGHFVFK